MIRLELSHPVTRRRVRFTVPTEGEAAMVRQRFQELRLALRVGTLTEADCMHQLRRLSTKRSGRVTLRDAAAPWAARKSTGTQSVVRSMLEGGQLATLAAEPLEALDAARLDRWLRLLLRSYADSSILGGWRILSAIVRAAISRGLIEVLPWGDWRPPRSLDATPRPRECATTPEQIAALLLAARELDDESRAKVADLEARMACGLLLGLAAGEITGLCWSDFDPARGRVTIARQYDGERLKVKARAAVLYAPPELFDALERLRVRLEWFKLYTPDGPLFPHLGQSRPGRPVLSGVQCLELREVRRVVRHAGLPNAEKWTVHSLRASFGCVELRASGSLAHAMARLRHRSVKATQHYARGLLDLEPPAPAWTLPPPPPKALPE